MIMNENQVWQLNIVLVKYINNNYSFIQHAYYIYTAERTVRRLVLNSPTGPRCMPFMLANARAPVRGQLPLLWWLLTRKPWREPPKG